MPLLFLFASILRFSSRNFDYRFSFLLPFSSSFDLPFFLLLHFSAAVSPFLSLLPLFLIRFSWWCWYFAALLYFTRAILIFYHFIAAYTPSFMIDAIDATLISFIFILYRFHFHIPSRVFFIYFRFSSWSPSSPRASYLSIYWRRYLLLIDFLIFWFFHDYCMFIFPSRRCLLLHYFRRLHACFHAISLFIFFDAIIWFSRFAISLYFRYFAFDAMIAFHFLFSSFSPWWYDAAAYFAASSIFLIFFYFTLFHAASFWCCLFISFRHFRFLSFFRYLSLRWFIFFAITLMPFRVIYWFRHISILRCCCFDAVSPFIFADWFFAMIFIFLSFLGCRCRRFIWLLSFLIRFSFLLLFDFDFWLSMLDFLMIAAITCAAYAISFFAYAISYFHCLHWLRLLADGFRYFFVSYVAISAFVLILMFYAFFFFFAIVIFLPYLRFDFHAAGWLIIVDFRCRFSLSWLFSAASSFLMIIDCLISIFLIFAIFAISDWCHYVSIIACWFIYFSLLFSISLILLLFDAISFHATLLRLIDAGIAFSSPLFQNILCFRRCRHAIFFFFDYRLPRICRAHYFHFAHRAAMFWWCLFFADTMLVDVYLMRDDIFVAAPDMPLRALRCALYALSCRSWCRWCHDADAFTPCRCAMLLILSWFSLAAYLLLRTFHYFSIFTPLRRFIFISFDFISSSSRFRFLLFRCLIDFSIDFDIFAASILLFISPDAAFPAACCLFSPFDISRLLLCWWLIVYVFRCYDYLLPLIFFLLLMPCFAPRLYFRRRDFHVSLFSPLIDFIFMLSLSLFSAAYFRDYFFLWCHADYADYYGISLPLLFSISCRWRLRHY